MTDLAKLVVRLEAETAKYSQQLDQATRKLQKFEAGVNGISKKIRLGVASVIAGISFGAVIRETISTENSLKKLTQAVQNNGQAARTSVGELVKFSQELQSVSTYGAGTIQEMQALLLSFRQFSGDELKRAQLVILDVSTALGVDLNSAAKTVARALADPIKGMSALAKMGVTLTSSQEDVIKKLTNSGKTIQAQNKLLDHLTSRFGGAAEAARHTLGGALAALKNAFNDLLSASDGVDGITRSINEMTDALSDPDVAEGARLILAGIAGAFANIAETVAVVAKGIGWFLKNSDKWDPLTKGINSARKELGLFVSDIDKLKDQIKFLEEQRDTVPLIFTLGKSRLNPDSFFGMLTSGDIKKRLEEMNRELALMEGKDKPGGAPPPPAVPEPSEDFKKEQERLSELIALIGKKGEAAKLSYALEKGAYKDMIASEGEALMVLARRADALEKAAEADKKAAEEKKAAKQTIEDMTADLEMQVATFEKGEAAVLRYRIAHGDLKKEFDSQGEASEKYIEDLMRIATQLDVLTMNAEKAKQAVEDFAEANKTDLDLDLEAFSEQFEKKFLDNLGKLSVFAEEASREVQNIIADSLLSGFDDGAKGILKSFGQMILKITAQAVAADIAKRLFGDGGVSSGGGWLGAAGNALKAWFGGPKDSGGRGQAGVPYMIGRGAQPEIFVPDQPGRFYPRGEGMGGGSTIVQHFSVKPESGDRVTRRTEQQIAAAASRGLAVASRRNN